MSGIGGTMHRALRWTVVGLASVLLTAACSDAGDEAGGVEPIDAAEPGVDDDADAEVVDDPEPEDAQDPAPADDPDDADEIDITVVPDEITLEYVDAVLVELERLYAEAIVATMQQGEPTIEAADLLRSAFSSDQFDLRVGEFYQFTESGFSGLAAPGELRPRVHSDLELLDVTTNCIWVRTRVDYSGWASDELPPEVAFLRLAMEDKSGLVVDASQTPWVISSIPASVSESAAEELKCE